MVDLAEEVVGALRQTRPEVGADQRAIQAIATRAVGGGEPLVVRTAEPQSCRAGLLQRRRSADG
jgi:hypothetical protein